MTILQAIHAGTISQRLTVDQVYDLTAAACSWNDNFELIDGEIVPMAAAKADWHELMKSRLHGRSRGPCQTTCGCSSSPRLRCRRSGSSNPIWRYGPSVACRDRSGGRISCW